MITNKDPTNEEHTPPRRYSSFLLRCWHVGETQLRIKIEHIQSADSTEVDTYEAVVARLSEHCDRTTTDHPASNRQANRIADDE